jgi:DNA modification methylase
MINLENRDGLEFLKTIQSGTVDLVLTDPPYQISKDSGMQNAINDGNQNNLKITQTDFGSWDREFSINHLEPYLAEFQRVLRKGGSCIIFYDLWKISYLKEALEKLKFSKLRFVEWVKTNPVPVNQSATYLSNAREIAISCVKGGSATFNSKYDKGIYSFPIYQDSLVGRIHPTQKSLPMIREMIQKHSNPGDLVIDTFSGSGTTAIGCLLENRKFNGCELDETFHDLSIKRIEKYKKKFKSDF